MIVLDADVLLIDMRYLRDARFARNHQVLQDLLRANQPLAITCHTLLKILGVSSFNLNRQDVLELAQQMPLKYRLSVLPNPATLNYAGLTVSEIQEHIAFKLSIGDAVTALQLTTFIPQAVCFLSWNARHFQGRLGVPALTPEEWSSHQQPAP